MFNNKQDKEVMETGNNSNNIIGKGTVIEGGLQTSGNLRIEGKVLGDIKCKSKVVIGQSALVDGNIISSNVEIFGEVKGFVRVSGILCLKSTAVVHGEIVAKELVIDGGAKFDGQCKMNANIKDIELMQPSKLSPSREEEKSNKNNADTSKVRNLKDQLKAVNSY